MVSRHFALELSVRVIFHAVLITSLYLLFAGHNQPGGGFVGGLLVGAAIAMRYAAGGIEEIRTLARFAPWTILGTGLLLAGVTAIVPIVLGSDVLEAALFSEDLPLVGPVKATSSLPFDVGVYLLVIGLVLMVFEAFGDDPTLDRGEGSRA
jgi:multicomponent Na+:H+ antiporter subunit A